MIAVISLLKRLSCINMVDISIIIIIILMNLNLRTKQCSFGDSALQGSFLP